MVFLNLRQRIDSVQALVTVTPEKVSKQMVKWVASLGSESIVLVEGVVKTAPEEIKSATVGDIEVHINKVSAASRPLSWERLPTSLTTDLSDRERRGTLALFH